MTEMSPLGTVCTIKPEYACLAGEERLEIQAKQGHAPFTVEMQITDDAGREVARDGKTSGALKVRGPAVGKAYFKQPGSILDAHGFFDNRDVAAIDHAGYMPITDHAQDVIQSSRGCAAY